MKRALYIAIEGIDGTGKTTLYNGLVRRFNDNFVNYDTLCPTYVQNKDSFIEKLYHLHKSIKRISVFRYLIFSYRSSVATIRVDWSVDLVIGDRCIVVSYVKRWRKIFNLPGISVWLVNLMEPLIPCPDYILYLDAPMTIISKRIEEKPVVEVDESYKDLVEMKRAYRAVRYGKKIKRIAGVEWIDVDASKTMKEVEDDVYEIIMGLIKNKKNHV